MTLLNAALAVAEEEPMFDPNSVTPGVIGFLATFAVIVIVVLLVTDMVRRVRRTQYRAQVNERLDAEIAAQTERGSGSDEGTIQSSNDQAANDQASDDQRPV